MREVRAHELDRGEHRLDVLVLMLDDHAVHERVREQRGKAWNVVREIRIVEIQPIEQREHPSADVGRERARVVGAEDWKRDALASGMLERVVQVVESRIGGCFVREFPQQPQLLVVRDVREVPAQGRHQARDLTVLIRRGNGREQIERAAPGACAARQPRSQR